MAWTAAAPDMVHGTPNGLYTGIIRGPVAETKGRNARIDREQATLCE